MSTRIDISNYEEYVIDYLEGTLNGDVLESFQVFLLAHPEIAAEIEDMAEADLELQADEQVSFDASSLKVNVTAVGSIHADNYEEHFAESAGNFLNNQQENELQDFMEANPALEKDFQLYQMTALKPDMAVRFDGKQDLKRPIPLWETAPRFAYRAAAILIVALGAWTVLQMIETRSYAPRQGGLDFASLDFEWSTPSTHDSSEPEAQVVQVAVASVTALEPTTQTKRDARIEVMPVLDASEKVAPAENALMASMESWDLAPYQVSSAMPTEISTTTHQRQQDELTLAQYLGREFLGVDPEDAPTTRALLREGVNKVAPKNDQFAIHSEANDDDRKTLHILAGGIEFKRVNYTKN